MRRFVGVAGEVEHTPSRPDERAMGEPPVRPSSIDTFSVQTGHNRFTWELEYPGPKPPAEGDGPLAVPGPYQVRLSVGDWSQTRSFELKMDPRVKASGVTRADLQEQFEFNLELRDAIGTAEAIAHAIDSVRTRVTSARENGEMENESARQLLDRLDALHSELVTAEEGSYQPPMLIDQLDYLAWMTSSADQDLGEDAFSRFETLSARLENIQSRWQSLRENIDVPTTD